jgi:oligoendopeptidase F
MALHLPGFPDFMTWTWGDIAPFYAELEARPLTAATLDDWMRDWGMLGKHLDEAYWRWWCGTTQDTTDAEAERRFDHFLTAIKEPADAAEQRLRRKLLASGLQPAQFAAPLRHIALEVGAYSAANLPLLTTEQTLGNQYDRLRAAQTVSWDGVEQPLVAVAAAYFGFDRARRERAWRFSMERCLQDRETLNVLWREMVHLRRQQAAHAGLPDYRALRWRQMTRADYTPQDCMRFHEAVAQVVVPVVERLSARRAQRLGIARVRPYDVEVEVSGEALPPPFYTSAELIERSEHIFRAIDPALAQSFALLRQDGLLDLENRPGKMPSSYCATFPISQRPFVFMNAVGTHEDVMTLFHECGHAFHTFACVGLPHHEQVRVGTEFHELAATAMEFITAPFWSVGGFATPQHTARVRIQHLETQLRFWPYASVVDAFQHWVYTAGDAGADGAACDATWDALWARFMTGEDWGGLDAARMTGWQRKLHIWRDPFYYIDYSLAQVGAVQIWAEFQRDPDSAMRRYHAALALGGTVSLPELYAAAGARLAFDADTLTETVTLIEQTITELEPIAYPATL